MSKLIIWKSETRSFEFQVNKKGTLSMTILVDKDPVVNCELTKEDVVGIEDIFSDLRWKLDREDGEKEESHV